MTRPRPHPRRRPPIAPRLAPLALLLAACSSASAEAPSAAPRAAPGVRGAITWLRNGYLEREAAWDAQRVAAGPRGGPPYGAFTRAADGKWKGGWDRNETVELVVAGARLTGPSVNVTFTRVEGGFRLEGLWFKRNVSLLVDAKGARAQGRTFTRDASGGYVSDDLPGWRIVLVGEAGRLEDPPWPEIGIAALSAGWGVRGAQ
jgi:hypothetical protein